MNEIKILWPTARPEPCVKALEHWIKEAEYPDLISVMFGVNTRAIADDVLLRIKNSDVFDSVRGIIRVQFLVMDDPARRGPVYPTCALAKKVQGRDEDIIILCSDDFYAPPHWDSWLREQFTGFLGGIVVNDGIQAPNGRALTIPIMSYGALLKMNRTIYPPVYDWLYSDNECLENLDALGMLKEARGPNDPTFQHRHWTVAGRSRDTVDDFSADRSDKDRATFNTRMKMTVQERLALPAEQVRSVRSGATLSILITHLEERAAFLKRLQSKLLPQVAGRQDVEILYETDQKQVTTGTKRNRLLDKAKNDYVVFIDDDDLVSSDYVSRIMSALQTRPDCVGIEGIITQSGRNPKSFKHGLQYTSWYERDGVYFRNPNHLNPIRRDLAVVARFPDATTGEDLAYSQRVQTFLKTEVYLAGPIYYYLAGDATIVPEGLVK